MTIKGREGWADDPSWLMRAEGVEERFPLTQKAALFAIQTGPLPDGAPGPLGNEFLPWPCEWCCIPHGIVNVLMAEDSPTNLQTLLEELVVEFGEFGVCA